MKPRGFAMSGRDNVSGGGGDVVELVWSPTGGHHSSSLAWFGGLQASEELPGFALSAARKRTKLAEQTLAAVLAVLPPMSVTVGEFQSLVPLVTREQQHWVQTVRHERAIVSFWLFGSLGPSF